MSRTLLAVSGLTHSLAHQLRTGLSVIQNELTCLQAMLPAGECERAFQRCRQMARSIREMSLLSAHELKVQDYGRAHFDSLLEDAFGLAPEQRAIGKHRPVRADEDKMRQVFVSLGELFRSSGLGESLKICWSDGDGRQALIFKSFIAPCEDTITFESLTAFFNFHLSYENYRAPLADAVLWAHGYAIDIALSPSGQVTITLTLE